MRLFEGARWGSIFVQRSSHMARPLCLRGTEHWQRFFELLVEANTGAWGKECRRPRRVHFAKDA